MSALFLFPKSKKKKILSTLYKIFGIGQINAIHLTTIVGLGRRGTLNILHKRYSRHTVLEILLNVVVQTHLLIVDHLRDLLIRRLKAFDLSKNARNIRRSYNLPLNGQRTKANAKTVKRIYFAQLRQLEASGVLLVTKGKKRRKTRREKKLIRMLFK